MQANYTSKPNMPAALLLSCSIFRHSTSRLPYALSKAGFQVRAIFPKNSLLNFSDYLDGGLAYDGQISVDALFNLVCKIIKSSHIDIIIPCDEMAVRSLDVMSNVFSGVFGCERIRELLMRWHPETAAAARLRSMSVESVRRMGVRTPKQSTIIQDVTSASSLAPLGTPIVVKRDHSCGGAGVFIVPSAEDAIAAASEADLENREIFADGSIVGQEFIPGQAASVSFSALDGRTLEAFPYVAVHQNPERNGAATVIKVIEHSGLMDATCQIVAGFGYSGFGGIDFILPSDGGPPVFLELNARPTQTSHLGSLFGADLCRAMACALDGHPYSSAFNVAGLPPIALFPSEWIRDRNSPHLLRSYHDVPWYERRIVASAVYIVPQLRPE